MIAALKSVGAITMFVSDPQRSKAFYERLFGCPIVNEDDNSVAFSFDNLVVNLLADRAAHGLIDPGSVATGESGSPPVRAEDRVGATIRIRERAKRGLLRGAHGSGAAVWGERVAYAEDPDGNPVHLRGPVSGSE